MSKKSFPVGWTLLGAGLMYIFDPGYGRRRRALMRDKAVRYLNKLSDAADVTIRDFMNRSSGLLAEIRTKVAGENAPEDSVLAERVRAELGLVASHPRAIEVMAKEGQVTLSGPVLAHEERTLLDRVATVRGVRNIQNRLEVHERPDDVPDLQGDRARRPRFDLLRSNWSPTTCLVTSVIGGTLAFAGFQRRNVVGRVFGVIGASLLARGLSNRELQRLIGIDNGRKVAGRTKSSAAPYATDLSTSSTLH